jgi:glycosyltransferase involved in cell wall biosynthesis
VRIVHVSDCFPPRTGGIESQVSDLATHQAAAGHEVHVLTATLGEGGERGGVVDLVAGVHVHRLGVRMPFGLPVTPAGPRLMRAVFAEVRPDAVHVHAGVLSPFAFDGARVAMAAHLPVAITWHCMLDGAVRPLRVGARIAGWGDAPAALSAVSRAAARRVSEVFGVPVDMVPNGMDLEAWAPSGLDEAGVGGSSRAPRPADSAEPRPVHLVSTMRLAPRKRAVPLIDLVAAAVRHLPVGSVRLTVIGSGPERHRVEAQVAKHGLQGVVELAGRLTREQVRDAYSDAEVFLAPAELEAFGIAALEARTAGLAVVARRGTGIEEFVEDGVDGLLVRDDREMAEAVVRLVRDEQLLERLRRHNREVRPAFGWDEVLVSAQAEYARAACLIQ